MSESERIADPTASWLAGQRWFGAKGRQIVEVSDELSFSDRTPGTDVTLAVIAVRFGDGGNQRYVLLRKDQPSDDALERAEVRAWLVEGFATAREVANSRGLLRWRTTDEHARTMLAHIGDSRVFRGEQSNTSVAYGEDVMLKLFRRVQDGVNPEVEIGTHLTMHTAFRSFPRLLGTIELETPDGIVTIAAAQAFIASMGDAWSWILTSLSRSGGDDESIAMARLLGVRTGELHAALASGTTVDFTPESFTADDARAVASEAGAELVETVAALVAAGHEVSTALAGPLEQAMEDFALLEGTTRIRIHGDYHLGQVLRTIDGDVAILDFEGEPSRSLEQRRAKASALRDTAGMLRSWDYAAEAARRAGMHATEAERWLVGARKAFEDGYTAISANDATLSRGLDVDRRRRLLRAFEVHKALYETRYELRNRPDWLDIPLNGLRKLAGTMT